MKLPRFIHKIYANLAGYFWHPCALCGKCYGGHEQSAMGDYLMTSWDGGIGVCPACGDTARELNKEFMRQNPPPPVTIYT